MGATPSARAHVRHPPGPRGPHVTADLRRCFAAHTGTTPHQWLTSQRLILAQELLERTDLGIEQVAADCGLAPLMLRRHFATRWNITPQDYRRRFTQLASCPVSIGLSHDQVADLRWLGWREM